MHLPLFWNTIMLREWVSKAPASIKGALQPYLGDPHCRIVFCKCWKRALFLKCAITW